MLSPAKNANEGFHCFLLIRLLFNWLGDIVLVHNFWCKFLVFACICRSFCSQMTYPGQWKASVAPSWGIKDSLNDFIWCVMFRIVMLKKQYFNNFFPFCSFLVYLLPSRIEENSHILFQKVYILSDAILIWLLVVFKNWTWSFGRN